MIILAKENRVVHLQMELSKLGMKKAIKALNHMIEVMNAKNGFKRKDGSNYYYHLVDSTQDLINAGIKNEATITACILHDSVEDIARLSLFDIANEYGFDVASIVDKVTKDPDINYKDPMGLNIKNYLNNILSDHRACLVKTADRKHNFSTMSNVSAEHELRQVIETETHFIPFFKQARQKYPEYSSYFYSAKTTIEPHLNRIKKAISKEKELEFEINRLKSIISDYELKHY